MGKLASLLLLGIVFAIGAFTSDGPAIAGGSRLSGVLATLAVVILMAIGVYAWSRLVRKAHESELNGHQSAVPAKKAAQLGQPHSEPGL